MQWKLKEAMCTIQSNPTSEQESQRLDSGPLNTWALITTILFKTENKQASNKQHPTKLASPKRWERYNSRNFKDIFTKNSLVLIFLISLGTGESFVKGLLWPMDLHLGSLAPSLQQQKNF